MTAFADKVILQLYQRCVAYVKHGVFVVVRLLVMCPDLSHDFATSGTKNRTIGRRCRNANYISAALHYVKADIS